MGHSPFRQLLAELKRRRVYRVAVVYAVVGWAILQFGDVVAEPLGLPEWAMTVLIFFVLLGFPVAVVLAWAFEITPEGVRRTESLAQDVGDSSGGLSHRTRNAALIGLGMLIAVLGIGSYAFFHDPAPTPAVAETSGEDLRYLAVLPFANMSPDAENEFFADGVMEDILTHLALVPDFSVVSRTTVMRYKDSPKSVVEIAGELGVGFVLEGSVRRAEDRVRITAQLVDGRTDQHLWAETYDRRIEDIFAVQTDIATAIARALETELSRGVTDRIERRPTEDLEAYDLFLRGRDHFYSYTADGTRDAIEAFQAALEIDPDFALARAWMGRAFAIYAFNHGGGPAWSDSALVHTRRAAEEQPDLAAAHTALGTALAAVGRNAEGQAALERAVELNPNDWAAIANLGLVYAHRGQQAEAIRLARRSLEREPARSHIAYTNLASFYGQIGLHERAEVHAVRALELEPEDLLAVFLKTLHGMDRNRTEATLATADWLAQRTGTDLRAGLFAGELYAKLGDAERTAEVLTRVYERSPTASNAMLVGALYGWALMELGRIQEADRVLLETEEHARQQISQGNERFMLPSSLIMIHALRGEFDQAFRLIERTTDNGWNVPLFLSELPAFATLREDPRFPRALERLERQQRAVRERVLREGL